MRDAFSRVKLAKFVSASGLAVPFAFACGVALAPIPAAVASPPSSVPPGATTTTTTTTAANDIDVKAYRQKYLFTEKKQSTTDCIRIVATAMRSLSHYRSCKGWSDVRAPLDAATAKCEKADGTTAYIFESLEACHAAKSVINGSGAQ